MKLVENIFLLKICKNEKKAVYLINFLLTKFM